MLFWLCFEKGVWLLVSCFIGGSSSSQNWRSKLDKIGFLVGFQKGRFGLRGTGYCDWFCVIFGTKLGCVLLFWLCFEKGVWLLVSGFIRGSSSNQNWRSKLDKIGFLVGFQKGRFGRGTGYCDWFCVIFGSKVGGVLLFRLCFEKGVWLLVSGFIRGSSSSQNWRSKLDKIGFLVGFQKGRFGLWGTCYCDWFCVIFGTKLGGVLLFRLCFEKGVWLLVSGFIRGSSSSQNWRSKLDKIGFLVGFQKWRFGLWGTCYCDWFCVIFGTKLGGVLLFRLCFEKGVWLLVSSFIRGSSSSQNWRSKLDKIGFLVGFQKGRFGLRGTGYCDWFCVIFGTKLGGVLLFRLCFEKGVWLLVSGFIRGSSSSQNWRSKLDKIGFLVGFQKGRFGLRGTGYCDWFCVIFSTKLGGVLLFRLCFEKGVWLLVSGFIRGSSSSQNWRSKLDKIGFLVGFQKGHHHHYHHHQQQQKRYWTQCRNITNTVRLASFKCHAPLLHHDEEYAKQQTEKHTMNLNGSSHKDTLTTHNTWIKSSPKHLSPPLLCTSTPLAAAPDRAQAYWLDNAA